MCKGELTWTQAAHVLRPVPTSAPLVPGPVLIAGVSPPAATPGRYRRRGQGTASPIQGSAGARDSNLDELSFWGEGGVPG